MFGGVLANQGLFNQSIVMEQPLQSGGDTGPGSSHTTPIGRSSPGAASVHGTPKSRRVPKVKVVAYFTS
uniref:Uncharacterized protein n=1 Tax=Ascaris lumbricoides TaxID=6252 RepID=A0A0M3HXT5_ASCLU